MSELILNLPLYIVIGLGIIGFISVVFERKIKTKPVCFNCEHNKLLKCTIKMEDICYNHASCKDHKWIDDPESDKYVTKVLRGKR